tara:strand:+ start:114 stop:1139 length:1026 start_codon:yes stop_codon:yes gene_type:complete
MKNINICIVGLGRMGERYIQICKKLNFKIIAIVDVNKVKLIKIKKKYELTNCNYYTSLSLMYNRCKINCIIISSTADTHFRFAKKAIENKTKYILIEKPLCVSVNQCEKLIQLRNKSISKIAVNHQMRYMDQYKLVKKIINSKKFGGLKSMTLVAGNCGISMNVTHYIEAFRYITSESPKFVTAWFDKKILFNPRGKKFKDRSGSLKVTTSKGTRLYIDVSSDQGHGLKVVYTSKFGQIIVDELAGKMFLNFREKQYLSKPTNFYALPSIYKTMKIKPVNIIASTSSVIKALINNKKDYVKLEDGINAVKVIIASYISNNQSNRKIAIDKKFNSKIVYPWA